MRKPIAAHRDSGSSANRAMSTTVGVGIAVALLVVAAAVGVFVLDLGGDANTVPDSSFESSEEKVSVPNIPGKDVKFDAPNVGLTLADGDTIAISQVRVAHQGRPNVWGLQDGAVNRAPEEGSDAAGKLIIEPATSPCATVGTEEAATWDPGATEYASLSTGAEVLNLAADFENGARLVPKHAQIDDPGAWKTEWGKASGPANPCAEDQYVVVNPLGGGDVRGEPIKKGSGRIAGNNFAGVLDQGHTVTVRWRSKSGEKSQKLFEHEVSSSSNMPP